MNPSCDPNSTKYPDRVFYSGQWRTPEQIEARLESQRRSNRRWKQTEKGRKSRRQWDRSYRQTANGRERQQAANSRRVFAGGMYLGRVGFTKKEREEILNGTSD